MDQTSVEKPTQVTIIIDYKDRCDTIELNAVERVFIESVYNNYNTEYDLVSATPLLYYERKRIKDINVHIEGVGRAPDNYSLTVSTKTKDEK